jgi:hypothetical protein
MILSNMEQMVPILLISEHRKLYNRESTLFVFPDPSHWVDENVNVLPREHWYQEKPAKSIENKVVSKQMPRKELKEKPEQPREEKKDLFSKKPNQDLFSKEPNQDLFSKEFSFSFDD